MLKLKRKQNAIIYKDQFGNEYPNMVAVATSVVINYSAKTLTAVVRYYKDDESLNETALMESTFVWDNTGRTPIDVEGNPIVWQSFMTTYQPTEWKDHIQDVGRVPFDSLSAGLDITVEGFGFVNNPVGQAWKQLMLFLPIHGNFQGVKFLDEVFEYNN